MDLQTHLAVIWRFRHVVLGGLALGIVLAVLASYEVSFSGGVSVVPRGTEEWTSTSRLLITQPGFPEGRTTLPGAPVAGQSQQQTSRGNGIEYADPSRFSTLAALYAVLSYSDQVRNRVPEKTKPGQISALPLDLNGSGQQFLPIVEIATKADSGRAARRLNMHTIDALRGLLVEQQERARIPAASRVRAETLNVPGRAVLTSGRSHVASILAFLLCLVGAIALAHILERVSINRSRAGGDPSHAKVESLEMAYATEHTDVDGWPSQPERIPTTPPKALTRRPPSG